MPTPIPPTVNAVTPANVRNTASRSTKRRIDGWASVALRTRHSASGKAVLIARVNAA